MSSAQLFADGLQGKLVVDHWISYLRNGLSTCYYCVAPNSFPEELQRKCVAHVRPSMSLSIPAEAASKSEPVDPSAGDGTDENARAAAEDAAGEDATMAEREDREDEDMRDVAGDDREGPVAAEDVKSRGQDEKRERPPARFHEERWAENLEHKIRPLLEQVDVTEYGGRDPDA